MTMRLRFTLVMALGASLATAGDHFPDALWEEPLPAALGRTTAAARHSGQLYLVGPSASPIHRTALADAGTTGTLEAHPAQGIPEPAEALALAIDRQTFLLWLAARVGDEPQVRLFRSQLSPDGIPGAFEETTDGPELRGVEQLVAGEAELLVIGTAKSAAEDEPLSLWRHFPLRRGQGRWFRGPDLPQDRRHAAAIRNQNHLLLAGGTERAPDGSRRPARFTASIALREQDWGPWNARLAPIDRNTVSAQGDLSGSSLVALLRQDPPTSVTIAFSSGVKPTEPTPWRSITYRVADGADGLMVLEPGVGEALLLDRGSEPRLVALPLPRTTTVAPESDAERLARESAAVLERIRFAQEHMRQRFQIEPGSEEFVLTIIPGDGRGGQEYITNVLGRGRPLNYARNAEVRVLQGPDAAEAARELRADRVPVMILHRRDGTVLGRLEGHTITPQDMFRLTEPMRAALPPEAPESAPADAPR